MYKMAVSGSEDRSIILWNPFSCRPMGTLTGHAAGIVAMAVNEKDSQIISAASDKVIKVVSDCQISRNYRPSKPHLQVD